MKRIGCHLFILISIIFTWNVYAQQMDDLHGDVNAIKKGEHSGNLFHLTFYTDGTLGTYENDPEDFAGEWPITSGHRYLMDGNTFVGSQVVDIHGGLINLISEVRGYGGNVSRGDMNTATGAWWTFLPLGGFANPTQTRAAMSKWPESWPSIWPDKFDDPFDPGWPGKWNGYFGKDVKNADEESYFVADDYNNREFDFFPDYENT